MTYVLNASLAQTIDYHLSINKRCTSLFISVHIDLWDLNPLNLFQIVILFIFIDNYIHSLYLALST